MTKLAISYLRCSTPEQSQGDSIRRQIATAEAYAKTHGFKLDRSINFHDQVSGYTGVNRTKGKLRLLLQRVREGLIPRGTALLVENLDRLSREHPLDSIDLIKELVTAGVEIHVLANNQVYTEARLREDFSCMLMLTFELGRGCGESDRKSYLLLKTWEQKRANLSNKKLTSICPQWLTLNDTGTAFQTIPERADIVRTIFDLSAKGYGKRRIAARLNRNGIEPWGRGKSKGIGWHASYVAKILRSRATLGEFQPHRMVNGRRVTEGDVIPNYFPAVIDRAIFERVNAPRLATGGQTREKVSNLFAGLVWDGDTEHRMVFCDKGRDKRKKQQTGNSKYLYSDRGRLQPDAAVARWNYSDFEAVVLRVLREIDWQRLRDQTRPQRYIELEGELATLNFEIHKLAAKIDRIVAAIADENGETPSAPIAAIKRLEDQKAAKEKVVRRKREELRAAEESEESLMANLDGFKSLAATATDPYNLELRLQLRDEIRRKVSRIDVYPSSWPVALQRSRPWLNPSSLFILFANGNARVVFVQPTGRGKAPQIKIADAPNGAPAKSAIAA
jgi:DNA invertase Pin-like site-specific DNA recombinase